MWEIYEKGNDTPIHQEIDEDSLWDLFGLTKDQHISIGDMWINEIIEIKIWYGRKFQIYTFIRIA